uniref:Uncharacterized protein n=1 Tax=Plectus sambesii TaxID=2011161 RepID=A0A914URA2_9BILA
MKSTQEFRLPGVGDDDSTENKSFEKVTKTFVIYEKLKALFFNCPVYHEFSRLPKKERPLQEATNLTESYQCAVNLSQAVKSRWLRNALVEINGSISSLDTIYETVVKNRSCSKAPISCCGVLCCVVFPQPLTSPKKDADELSALTTLGGIAAFIGAAAAIGVVLCVANYISLHRTKKAEASLDEEDADRPTREEVEQMMADGKLKRVRRGPQLRS